MRSLSGVFCELETLTWALPHPSLRGSCFCSFFLQTCSSFLVETSFLGLETFCPCHPGILSWEGSFLPCMETSFDLHSCSCSSS